jgi:multicomponent K+:H+ antiporter subunit G
MTSTLIDIVITLLLLLGGAFALIGSWGLARLSSLMPRLHGPTKATTLGLGGCLIASMIYFPTHGLSWSAHELLITLFLFITAPVSANMIAKAWIHERHRRRDDVGDTTAAQAPDLPDAPSPDAGWATLGAPGIDPAQPARHQGPSQ